MSNHRRWFMPLFLFMTSIMLLSATSHAEPADVYNDVYNTEDHDQVSSPAMESSAEKNYAALRDALPRYEDAVSHPWPEIPDGLYKLHKRGKRIIALRLRLSASGDLPQYANINDPLFDQELLLAVENFQQRHGLVADGIVGEKTIRELNVPAAVRLQQLQVNMQRWANLSKQMHDHFIIVNVPDFRLHAYDHDQEVLTIKAIVGKVTRQTPELSSRITRLVFNPYWNVPAKIARKDIAPKMLNDPEYLYTEHIRVFDSDEDDANQVNPDRINWEDAAENGVPYHLRQDPGVGNALGLVKFEFQNSADVYLHDTPHKELFSQDVRTFSSGCVRLQNPFALVEYLMQSDDKWNNDRMQDILGTGKTTYVRAARATPIFITYLTAWVDDAGNINFRDDVYDRDSGEQNNNGQDQQDDADEDPSSN